MKSGVTVVQLIIAMLSLTLIVGAINASISYIPAWQYQAAIPTTLGVDGFKLFQTAYLKYEQASGNTAVNVNNWDSTLKPYYGFVPRAPDGMAWGFGLYAGSNPSYAGYNYFYLTKTGGGAPSQLQWEVMKRISKQFSTEQFFLSSTCGEADNVVVGVTPPNSVCPTLFVKYIP